MEAAVASGNGDVAKARLLSLYRLKTAVPVGSLGRMAALAGGGSEAQIRAVGRFFEALGVAHEIMNDVRSLRAPVARVSTADAKPAGYDVSIGRVTAPLVLAVGHLPVAQMQALWLTVLSKRNEQAVISDVVAQLEACGAVQRCEELAAELVVSTSRVCRLAQWHFLFSPLVGGRAQRDGRSSSKLLAKDAVHLRGTACLRSIVIHVGERFAATRV
jgi:geranylgeranyl pyrophosphate synthase